MNPELLFSFFAGASDLFFFTGSPGLGAFACLLADEAGLSVIEDFGFDFNFAGTADALLGLDLFSALVEQSSFALALVSIFIHSFHPLTHIHD